MNQKKIEKIRNKFMVIACLSFFLVMLFVGGLMYLSTLIASRSEMKAVTEYLAANEGNLTDFDGTLIKNPRGAVTNATEAEENMFSSVKEVFDRAGWLYSSEESRYSLRYFAVLFDADENIEQIKTNHIVSVEDSEAEALAREALQRRFRFGRSENYYYRVAERKSGGTIVVYVEAVRQINSVMRLLYTALGLIGLGSIATLILIRILSNKIVEQEMKSIEVQDRFLTNASHELKTPLAVIKANTEAEQLINGESEWNQSTMRQVERMSGLIQSLIRIFRAEEMEDSGEIALANVSELVKETADTFLPLAVSEDKKLKTDIEPSIHFLVRESDLRQLLSLLVDNAIKYCDANGLITVAAKSSSRTLRITVSNDYAEGADVDYSRFFERFYRKDEAHNIEKGGYGVGLSIAEGIVGKYHGSISADWKEGVISFVCVFHQSARVAKRVASGK